jgi:chromate transporter
MSEGLDNATMSETVPLNAPRSKTDLFLSFTVLALQGFGGVLAVVQRELVEKKRWMTQAQFVEDWAVAQIMPGPNVVLILASVFGGVSDALWAQGALRGMGAVAAGLIAATGIKLISALKLNPMGLWACFSVMLSTFVCVSLLRWPLLWVLLGIGSLACAWAYLQLTHLDPNEASS